MNASTTHTQQPTLNQSLRRLLDDPNGAYQRWRRHEAPYHEMCRAVVLAYCRKEKPVGGRSTTW